MIHKNSKNYDDFSRDLSRLTHRIGPFIIISLNSIFEKMESEKYGNPIYLVIESPISKVSERS
jgi:hypothetical protein